MLRLLFDDSGAFLRRFHADVNADDHCVVTPCAQVPGNASAKRCVSFTKRMDLPTAITRLLGDVSAIRVDETQLLSCAEAKGCFASVGSEPVVAMAGLERFQTKLMSTLEARGARGCTLRTRVRVEASVYGVQRLVEGAMAKEASVSVLALHAYASVFVAAHLARGGACPPALALFASVSGHGHRRGVSVGSSSGDCDAFFDSEQPRSDTGSETEEELEEQTEAEEDAGEGGAPQPQLGDWFASAVLRELRALTAASAGARATLVSLEARCGVMQAEVVALRAEAQAVRRAAAAASLAVVFAAAYTQLRRSR